MVDGFVLRALVAGCGIALVTGPLGCFLIWRRMAYFADALAHAAILGIALGLVSGIGLNFGIVLVAGAFSFGLSWLQSRILLSRDAFIGLIAHAALALGLVVLSTLESVPLNLFSILFGDVLAVTQSDLVVIGAVSVFGLLMIWFLWPRLVAATVSLDIAHAEGAAPRASEFCLTLVLTFVIAMAVKLVGVLLVASLLLFPAASARQLARRPEQMALMAPVFGMISVFAGLASSLQWDLPAGPTIVVAATVLFLIALLPRAIGFLIGRWHPGSANADRARRSARPESTSSTKETP